MPRVVSSVSSLSESKNSFSIEISGLPEVVLDNLLIKVNGVQFGALSSSSSSSPGNIVLRRRVISIVLWAFQVVSRGWRSAKAMDLAWAARASIDLTILQALRACPSLSIQSASKVSLEMRKAVQHFRKVAKKSDSQSHREVRERQGAGLRYFKASKIRNEAIASLAFLQLKNLSAVRAQNTLCCRLADAVVQLEPSMLFKLKPHKSTPPRPRSRPRILTQPLPRHLPRSSVSVGVGNGIDDSTSGGISRGFIPTRSHSQLVDTAPRSLIATRSQMSSQDSQ